MQFAAPSAWKIAMIWSRPYLLTDWEIKTEKGKKKEREWDAGSFRMQSAHNLKVSTGETQASQHSPNTRRVDQVTQIKGIQYSGVDSVGFRLKIGEEISKSATTMF